MATTTEAKAEATDLQGSSQLTRTTTRQLREAGRQPPSLGASTSLPLASTHGGPPVSQRQHLLELHQGWELKQKGGSYFFLSNSDNVAHYDIESEKMSKKQKIIRERRMLTCCLRGLD